MYSVTNSFGLNGLRGFAVAVEADVSGGLPAFSIVGLPDSAVRESADRVRAAIKNLGFRFPDRRITINLAPADVRKTGPVYDLPLLLALLTASGQLEEVPADAAFLGELALDGSLRPVSGVLPMALAAAEHGIRALYVPTENAAEAAEACADTMTVYPAHTAREVVEALKGIRPLSPAAAIPFDPEDAWQQVPDFADVMGQLEDGQITVSRAAGSATYPSHFQLVAAMNPCKCGYYGHPTRACTCSPSAVRQYRSRVSGPLLDRIDLCVEMDPIAFDELHTAAPSESSAELRKQVLAARAIQAKRYAAPGFKGVHCNAQLNAGQVRRICRMTPGAEQLLRSSYDALGLSARAHDRILRVARTVADLAGKTLLDEDSLLEALQYRAQEKLDG